MLTYFQSIILGVIQGFTELFPVSSLGHSVILPSVLGWTTNQNDSHFLIFLVATHLATSLVLFGFFFKDWMLIFQGVIRSLRQRKIDSADIYAKIGWLIIVGTIPAGVIGLLFEEKIKILFATPLWAAVFLFLNGVLLFGVEYVNKKNQAVQKNKASEGDAHVAALSWVQSIKIGFAQALALIPGFSRTGATLGGGLLVGLTHENAARFSFLLATPIIFAAAALKLPELWVPGSYDNGPLVLGMLVSAAAAYLSVRFLTIYFKTKTLKPFGYYCCAAGAIAVFILLMK